MKYERAWLNYKKAEYQDNVIYLKQIIYQNEDAIMLRAIEELSLASEKMYGNKVRVYYCQDTKSDTETGVLLKQCNAYKTGVNCNEEEYKEGSVSVPEAENNLGNEGYQIIITKNNVIIEANTSNGILYGVFEFLRILREDKMIEPRKIVNKPKNPLRMLNHWDNMDGSIERGYSGKSFFFQKGEVIVNNRTKEYARLAASVGINGVVINNVNVKDLATYLITEKYRNEVNEIAKIFSSFGIQLFLSINFAAPMELGGLDSADPLDKAVIDWWKAISKDVFEQIENFGGFLVKADSEGRPGPFTYERTHVDGANMLAEAVAPYGGLIIWRCFVYNCQQDWRDKKTDRARAGYDHFMPLDGKFLDNVILQIKNGPMDFQVREPISPLFGGLKKTNQMLEVQIAQEYTGQQRHVCYLIPMFKEVLKFRTYCEKEHDLVEDIVSGRTYQQVNCGMAAVANTGDDANWTGHDLAAANFYGFGRLSFNTNLTAEEIAKEWIILTFGTEPAVVNGILNVLMMSWPAYEKYTSPLGIGWMVQPNHHYGPNVDGYEYDRWGTYHRADHKGIGVDRSSLGTGYASLYHEPNKSAYETIESCPEELLLFFHYVPYTYQLSSGKTLIQHIYDTHFDGVSDVIKMIDIMEEIRDYIEPFVYKRMMARMEHQLLHAKEWRDVICSYFYRKSGMKDEKGREIF